MLNLFIGMPKSLISVNMNVAHTNSEVEDCGMSILQYPHALAELNVSLNDMDEKQGFFFQCEHAEITVPWSVHCKKQLPNGFYEPDPESEKKFQKMYDHLEGVKGTEGHDALIKNYLDALEGKDILVVTSEDGRHALELIYSIYKSATTHHMVTLPMEESDDFYHKETLLKKVPHFYEKSVSIENAEGSISVGNMEKEK
jgi:predicted dehydrogenase